MESSFDSASVFGQQILKYILINFQSQLYICFIYSVIMYLISQEFIPAYIYFYIPHLNSDSQPSFMPVIPQEQVLPSQNTLTNENREEIVVTREDLLQEGYQTTKRAWTEEEDGILVKLCSNQNASFEQIAKKLEGRNAKMCYSRYRRLCNQSKDSWTKAQDDKLRRLVEQFGQNSWKSFAESFPKRNHKQLKDHYENYLRPNLANFQWTLSEDLELISLVNQYGRDWKLVQARMAHRSRNQIKNRFFGRILRINKSKVSEKAKNANCRTSQPALYDY